jgi:hypothetical protein
MEVGRKLTKLREFLRPRVPSDKCILRTEKPWLAGRPAPAKHCDRWNGSIGPPAGEPASLRVTGAWKTPAHYRTPAAGGRDDDEVPLEEIEQVAKEPWQERTRARIRIACSCQAGMEGPGTDGGHDLAEKIGQP